VRIMLAAPRFASPCLHIPASHIKAVRKSPMAGACWQFDVFGLSAPVASVNRLASQPPVTAQLRSLNWPPRQSEQAVVGETPNLAARLQALAEPGAAVIATSTRRLTGRHMG
jgi:hypothetical protein